MAKLTSNIPHFSRYHVTSEGKVIRISTGKEIKPLPHHNTHRPIVHLYDDWGKRYNLKVYRLVAEAYIPNPKCKPFVCHKDNDFWNNRVDNLYWGTPQENSSQMVKDHRSTKGKPYIFKNRPLFFRGWQNRMCKLTQEDFQELKAYLNKPSASRKKELISKWNISRRSFDRYVQRIKEDYYGKDNK